MLDVKSVLTRNTVLTYFAGAYVGVYNIYGQNVSAQPSGGEVDHRMWPC